ncbi:peptidoglycan-binding protein [Paenibacillus thermoaerophilus]|uniref:Peptidoglycan-binding protein n=1 Tax=Paenibacillus thermoaerophilus TaxID=1215385 RepID=A0ABW2V658_9BACL|nr:peptidoglycan-binding protein [Paenibacillus thermoaerophilus]TMV06306.1 peptidoglycan-binding protein [Paenibacillus thermoaerophilus]
MSTVKKKFFSLAVLLSLLTTTFLTVPAQAAESCVLSTMTDPLALRMEAGETVIWDGVTADLLAAKNRYESLIRAKGWSITYNSAYRPYQYQKHLYEISQNPTACSAEKTKHGLGTLVAAPSYTAPHTAGIAFDATVKNASGVALNGMTFVNSQLVAVAEQAGLYFPHTTSDGVHHQLSPTGSVLSVGSTGPEVTTLQTNLNKVGYTVTVDGIFGSGTESVVKQFQSAHGLTVDGKVGSATSTKLNTLAATTKVLRVGSTGDEVKVLQRLLTKKGYPLTADGVFGSGTEAAVKKFQQAKGLTVDGIVGSATWNKLRS